MSLTVTHMDSPHSCHHLHNQTLKFSFYSLRSFSLPLKIANCLSGHLYEKIYLRRTRFFMSCGSISVSMDGTFMETPFTGAEKERRPST